MMADNAALFDLDDYLSKTPVGNGKTRGHVWTENKAKLIARYLRSFTYVTRHGTYLDAFAGPQEGSNPSPNSWAAKLTLENEPKWMKRFVLCDRDPEKLRELESIAAIHHEGREKSKRSVQVIEGDSNLTLPAYLNAHPIAEKEASFCLLDQHTKECTWSLVEKISQHKKTGYKIELFYFLAQGWIDRVLTEKLGDGNVEKVVQWLGHSDWKSFKELSSRDRAEDFVRRFNEELGYNFSKAFPIYQRGNEGKEMFWMIHASDHERALPLMGGAYTGVGLSLPEADVEQLDFLTSADFSPS